MKVRWVVELSRVRMDRDEEIFPLIGISMGYQGSLANQGIAVIYVSVTEMDGRVGGKIGEDIWIWVDLGRKEEDYSFLYMINAGFGISPIVMSRVNDKKRYLSFIASTLCFEMMKLIDRDLLSSFKICLSCGMILNLEIGTGIWISQWGYDGVLVSMFGFSWCIFGTFYNSNEVIVAVICDWYLLCYLVINFCLREVLLYIVVLVQSSFIPLFELFLFKLLTSVRFSCFLFRVNMSQQSHWITKSGEKKAEVVRSGLRISVPRFDNSEIIARYARTLIGRCMNRPKQDMKVLLFVFPRIWNMEGRVVGTDLGLGRFPFDFEQEEDITEVLKMVPYHFDFWMVSLVRWKPVLEPNYPTKITFWVRVLDIPLQFRAAQIFQSVGEAIGQVQGPVDIVEGRVRVEIDGFKPLVFSMDIEFEEGVEIKVALRYEKLYGFCTECFCLTHECSRCPRLHKEELLGAAGGGPDGGAQATSYKAVVAHGSNKSGERREHQQTRAQNNRGGDKGKGIAYEKQGSSKQDGSFHPYKGKLTRGYGDGSSMNGRVSGYGQNRRGMQARGAQPKGVVPRSQHLSTVAEGEQQLPDPSKLMLDAFKGAGKSSGEKAPIGVEAQGSGSHNKACKALLFEESSSVEHDFVPTGEGVELGGSLALKMQSEGDDEVQKLDERALHTQALDDANMMLEGELLSDSELLLEEGEELEDWEHGELTDVMEEEVQVVDESEGGDHVGMEANAGKTDVVDEGTAPLKKGAKGGIGGTSKKRLGPGFVSPRKKFLAKVAAKPGDKGAKRVPSKP